MTLPSLTVPPPTRRARIEVQRRLQLGVTLDGLQVIYDHDAAYRTIHLRVLRSAGPEALAGRMRNEEGCWVVSSNFDEDKQTPEGITVDFTDLGHYAGPEAEVIPVVLEAIAVFYDSDELAPLHRRALRAFHRELTYVTAAAKL